MKKNSKDYIYEGAILCGVGLLLMLVLFGAFGKSGDVVSDFFVGVFGYASYVGAVLMFIGGVLRFFRLGIRVKPLKLIGLILMIITLMLLSHIATTSDYMGKYGEYLGRCYNGANSVGGALIGVIAYPLMAINYYFAIITATLLFIASTVLAFFVEIRNKTIYRTFVKGKGRESKLISNADEADEKRDMLNEKVTLYTDEGANTYEPLGVTDDLSIKKESDLSKSEFSAPAAAINPENYGSVRVVSDRERAARVLYGEKSSDFDGEAEVNEPKEEKSYSAVDVLYGNAPIEEKSDKPEFKLEGNYQAYTNNARKKIIEERIAQARQRSGDSVGHDSFAGERGASDTLHSDIEVRNYVGNDNAGERLESNPFIAAGQNNAESVTDSYTDVGYGLQKSNTANNEIISAERGVNDALTGRTAQGFGYGGNTVDTFGASENKTSASDDGVVNSGVASNKAEPVIGEKSAENLKLQEYKEMLLRKRKERSDKGGEHQSPQPAPIRSVVSGDSGASAEFNAGASKIIGENGFSSSITKTDQTFARHNIKEDRPAADIEKPKLRPYKAPPIAILREYAAEPSEREDFQEKIEILENTLSSFNINAKVANVVTGPAFTRLELQMPVGVSVNKISGLSNDIAMCLEAKSVRCQIPIPGKNLFGVEIPNKKRGIVGFKGLISSPEFNTNKHALSFAVGQDCDGKTYVVDLNKMPHLLIAGSTGSGKSVCINTLICSLLYKYSPDDVKIALVDPKQVELSTFNGLPHLLVSQAICDNDKVLNLLDWTIEEMENRYTLMSERRVKNIAQYNETIDTSFEEKLPYIVVVVDEVADIVLNLKREFEERIMRLAQKARAAGIILVLATQRPSVDVITGSIKANLPSRIAFAVTNFADSKTIIDSSGAEKLLGNGDMLFSESTSPDLVRLQGAFIDAAEVNAVCDFIRENNDSWFDPRIEAAIMKKATQNNQSGTQSSDNQELDLLFVKSLWNVIESGQASASRLQRTIGIGFPKASRYIDMMENMGYVGKSQGGNKPREVLLSQEQFLAIYGDVELY